jgi:hypothetical protein
MIIKNSDLSNESIAALNVLIEQDINASSAFRLMRVIKELSSIVDDKLKMEKKIYDKWGQRMRMVLLFRWTPMDCQLKVVLA